MSSMAPKAKRSRSAAQAVPRIPRTVTTLTGSQIVGNRLITVPARWPRRVDKRSAVHQRRRGIRWTALSLVHPTTEPVLGGKARRIHHQPCGRHAVGGGHSNAELLSRRRTHCSNWRAVRDWRTFAAVTGLCTHRHAPTLPSASPCPHPRPFLRADAAGRLLQTPVLPP